MKPLLVSDNLDGNELSEFVIDASDNLPEAPFAKNIYNLISIREMISRNNSVVAAFIVVAKVRGIGL